MNKSFRKIFAILAVVTVLGAMCIPFAFAEGAASANYASEAVSAMKSGFGEVTGTITIANVLTVLAIVLGTAVGFFFFWWGIRKVIRVVSKSFKSGRVSV